MNLRQFQWQVKSTILLTLGFGERLKSGSVSDQSVNMKFNVFLFNVYKRFLFLSRFYVFDVFLISKFFFTSIAVAKKADRTACDIQ